MAEDQDDAQKTEEPSQRKLEESAKKGDVPVSQELKHLVMLAGSALAFVVAAGPLVEAVRGEAAGFIAHAHAIPVNPGNILAAMRDSGAQILLAMMLPFGILLLAGLAGNLLQMKPMFTTEKIKPKPEKISVIKGAKRMFSARSTMEFFKTMAKFVIVSTIVALIIWPERDQLLNLVSASPAALADTISYMALKTLLGVVGAMIVIAAIDVTFQRLQHLKKMRMTKQEVKDEYKQMEGDPQVKSRLRQIRMDKAKKRMMAVVPESDVVIANPTHYAVALKYRHGEMHVPVVTAKGIDEIALRIRAVAEEHAIPVVENPQLARALYATAEIDDEIPPDQYQAVAEVIGYVLRLRKRGRATYRPSLR